MNPTITRILVGALAIVTALVYPEDVPV